MQTNQIQRDKLWNKNFLAVCAANFLMCFAFYILMPTMPFFLKETFGASNTMIGIVLSCYTLAILFIRPFSGYIADSFPRKPVYVAFFILYFAMFLFYPYAHLLWLFIACRMVQGLFFGILSTSGNTLVIDVMPSSRRGEGIGYYGAMNNLAMAFGPMIGLILLKKANFNILFYTSAVSTFIGVLCAASVVVKSRPLQKHEPISLNRFLLIKGLPCAFALVLGTVAYGMTNSYIALYSEQIGLHSASGAFFAVMAVGLVLSRVFSGKKVDQGHITDVVQSGFIFVVIGVLLEIFLSAITGFNHTLGFIALLMAGFMAGYGYGTMVPALNTLFINLAPNNRRATANSTYLTSWDIGIGSGLFLGGYISEHLSFPATYAIGVTLVIIAMIMFIKYVTPHYHKNKLTNN